MDDLPRLTRAELALLDRLATEEYGLPTLVLMENAGRGAAEEILLLARGGPSTGARGGRIAVFAGPGNNGGDAFVVARHLANAGIETEIFSTDARSAPTGEPASDAARMRRAVERMGIAIHDVSDGRALASVRERFLSAPIVVDGLLGTGFSGSLRPAMAGAIEAVNLARREGGAIVVALDLPSGLDADTGRPSNPTVVADLTVTFAAMKRGFDAPEAKPHLGRVVVETIGAPSALLERVRGRADRADRST